MKVTEMLQTANEKRVKIPWPALCAGLLISCFFIFNAYAHDNWFFHPSAKTDSGKKLSPRIAGEPVVPMIDTSLMLNPFFFQYADYWDKPGMQYPINGGLQPYDPNNDPGFNVFEVGYGYMTVHQDEIVQQRILLSPGLNRIRGKYSTFDAGSQQWSPFIPFVEVIENPYDLHLMGTFTLEARDGKKTRYKGLRPQCLSKVVRPHELAAHIDEELESILELHMNSHVIVPPDPTFPFQRTGYHPAGKYMDYTDLSSFTALGQSMHVPSPHANLYLQAVQSGFKEYTGTAYNYAQGVLSSLGVVNPYLLPCRYNFQTQEWMLPVAGQVLPLSNLLNYLCKCADLTKEDDFFVAAFLVAREMLEFNWWALNDDPEGLYFISNKYSLNANNELEGWSIARTPLASLGASVSPESVDHWLLIGTASISRFVRLIHDNQGESRISPMDSDFILKCYQAIDRSLLSFCQYADQFNMSWVDNLAGQTNLTESWWSNYDRRDDYAGYSFGLGMVPIFADQVEIFGYSSVMTKYWAQRMLEYIDEYQVMWEENTRRGGQEAADTYRFYRCFSEIRAVEECIPWSDQYLLTYITGLLQIYKGFVSTGFPPDVGTWGMLDWEPVKTGYGNEVTAPGMLYSWAADVYEISRDNGGDLTWFSTIMDAMLTMILVDKGEAGYEKDMSVPESVESGGEFRLAIGLFDMVKVIRDI